MVTEESWVPLKATCLSELRSGLPKGGQLMRGTWCHQGSRACCSMAVLRNLVRQQSSALGSLPFLVLVKYRCQLSRTFFQGFKTFPSAEVLSRCLLSRKRLFLGVFKVGPCREVALLAWTRVSLAQYPSNRDRLHEDHHKKQPKVSAEGKKR